MTKDIHLVITSGEPAGIGPEVSYQAAMGFIQDYPDTHISIVGDRQLFPKLSTSSNTRLQVRHVDLLGEHAFGKLNVQNAQYVLELLDQAFELCRSQQCQAMVTAPLQKSVINDAGVNFSGHTEYLAAKAGVSQVVMMLCGDVQFGSPPRPILRVALVTTHLALQDVPRAINQALVAKCIAIIDHDLKSYFGITHPKIRVAGLNPHAGESGYLGQEEILHITPAIQEASARGIHVTGPYPADTMFDLKSLAEVDVFLAMYHDQGLAPLKFATFGTGVNVTLGLPIIRTSVDHGTALDIAGRNMADSSSMYAALKLAYDMVQKNRRYGTSGS